MALTRTGTRRGYKDPTGHDVTASALVDETGAHLGTPARPLPVSDPNLEIARGRVTGISEVHKFGANRDIDAGVTEDIWPPGGVYPWQTGVVALEVVSTDANDTAAGTGARSIKIDVLDSNWQPATLTLATAGTGASAPTSAVVRRINRACVGDVGTYGGTNVGALTIRVSGGGATLAQIDADAGQTLMTMYTVPAGHTAYLSRISALVQANKEADVNLVQRQSADDVTGPPYDGARRIVVNMDGLEGPSGSFFYRSLIEIPEKTDIWARATASGTNTKITVEYDLFLVTN